MMSLLSVPSRVARAAEHGEIGRFKEKIGTLTRPNTVMDYEVVGCPALRAAISYPQELIAEAAIGSPPIRLAWDLCVGLRSFETRFRAEASSSLACIFVASAAIHPARFLPTKKPQSDRQGRPSRGSMSSTTRWRSRRLSVLCQCKSVFSPSSGKPSSQ